MPACPLAAFTLFKVHPPCALFAFYLSPHLLQFENRLSLSHQLVNQEGSLFLSLVKFNVVGDEVWPRG